MEQTPSPKVSVLMAVKDGEKYLREAVDSILAQTFSDFEFIIVDDGSKDGTAQILGEYSDTCIVVIRNKTNIGLTKSLNLGLKKARGEYIARMDADDISLPDRLNAQVEYLDEHPDVDVLGTAVTLIDEQENHAQDIYFPKEHSLIKWFLCFYNPIVHPSVMMRSLSILKHGGYDDSVVRSQDYDLWWRISADGILENMGDVHLLLRKHHLQVSSKQRDEQFEDGLKIVQKQVSLVIGRTIPIEIFRHIWMSAYVNAEEAIAASNFLADYLGVNIIEVENKIHRKI